MVSLLNESNNRSAHFCMADSLCPGSMSRYVSVVFLILCLVEQTASISGNFINHVIGNPSFCILINLRKSRVSAVLPQRKLVNIFAFSCNASIICLSITEHSRPKLVLIAE